MKSKSFTHLAALLLAVAAHAQTNLTWDPGTSQTGTAVYANSDTNAGLHLFQVTTTNTAASVGYWRTVLNVTSGEADLYISQSAGITTNSYTQKSDTDGSDRIVRSLSAGQTWYLLVAAESNSTWSIFAGDMHVEELVWDPGSAQSGTEVFTNPGTAEDSYLFRITTTNTAASLGYWRTVLNVSSGNADLYTYTAANIAPGTYQYRSEQSGSDTIVQSLTAGQTKYILVEAEEGAAWSLFAGDIHLTELTWDPGTADQGTAVFNNLNTDGGAYYFKITTELPDLAAWRTALDVLSGEADVYIKQNALPYINSGAQSFTDSSMYVGDDGFTRYLSNTSGAGQTWYILVLADTGSTWNLLSGDVYARDLGALAAGSGSGSGVDEVPPEGIRYYKTTIPVSAYAWRLWLQDAAGSNTLNNPFYVRLGLAPHPSSTSYYDRTRTGQGLLVPDFVVPGSASYYYVGVPGAPGDTFQLDSRQHEITDTTYNNTLVGESVSGYLYKTYRIPVPPEQIAWEVTVEPVSGTDPDLAVRLDKVPNAFNNTAFSEVNSSTESDSITLVPTSLSDGAYYVTVYGDAGFSFNLRNREPVITQINFSSSSLNNDPNRAGWRYFAVSDIGQQLGQLGWLLELSNHVPGTEIAIRRNFVPGRWSYRQNGSTTIYQTSHNDLSSTVGFLQDPDHAADVWYIGIYSPAMALGAFTLDSGPFLPGEVAVDGYIGTSIDIAPQSWNFYHIDVPAQTNGQDVLGWEIRTTEWSNARPYMVLRRDLLPDGISGYSYWNQATSWPSGYQWSTSYGDWSAYIYGSSGPSDAYPQYLLSMAIDRPLEPGSYYLGFYNNSASVTGTYSFASSAIGTGMTYDPQPIAFNGGSAIVTNLPARGVTYFSVEVPTNTVSWEVWLENTTGETSLFIREGYVPTYGQHQSPTYSPGIAVSQLTTLRKTGDEHYVLLPENGQTVIPAGTYYLMVLSEGQNPSGNTIGSGTSSAILHSLGEAVVADLGAVPVAGELVTSNAYNAGQMNLMQFEVPAGVLALELRLEDRVGSPEMNLRTDTNLPYGASYGSYSGYNPGDTHPSLITLANPVPGTYSLMVNDSRAVDTLTAGSYTLKVITIGAIELPIDGGGDTSVVLPPQEWRYYHLDIPVQTNGQDIIGWELRTTEWANSRPYMVVCRDELPESIGGYSYWNQATTWPSGYQWSTSYGDWSAYIYGSSGPSDAYPQYLLSMGMGRPLEPGSYYIGFYNNSASVTGTYSFVSSAIGSGMTYEPQPIAFNGGSAIVTNLPPRGVAYFSVEVPSNTTSWKVHLENTSGETSLFIREGNVPTYGQHQSPTYSPGIAVSQLPTLRKSGDEHYVLLPENGQTVIPAGTYYLMVLSEGQNPSGNTIGSGTSSSILHSLGETSVTDLGAVPVAGELVTSNAYNEGEINLMQFEVPAGVLALEVRLEDRVGSPEMNLRTDTNLPYGTSYGSYSGYNPGDTHPSLITLANPVPGTYSLMVNDSRGVATLTAGSYTLRIIAVGATEIAIDGGGDMDVVLPPQEWRYYHIDIPAQTNGQDILGWELRTTDWSNSRPYMVVCRDELPESVGGYSYWNQATTWPSGYQWSTSYGDWSAYIYGSSGPSDAYPQYLLSMAIDRPLEPGSYYIGFYNNSASVTGTYSFVSSAIGNGMTYEPQPIAFNGGSAVVTNLPGRDVAYFTVEIPTNTSSWEVHLENTIGETSLFIRKDYVPTYAQNQNPTYSPGASIQLLPTLRKSGDEHYVLLPENGQTTVPPGTYYLMVESEGQNPSGNTIGTNTSSAILHSLGEATVSDLGTLPLSGSLVQSNAYEAGEVDLYHFTIPSGVLGVQMQLENVFGNPEMNLRTDANLPNGLNYGLYSGYNDEYYDQSIITVPNPATGTWSMVIGEYGNADTLANGGYQLVIEDLIPPDLNIDAVLNTNGNSNVGTGSLTDDQRHFYRVVVPASLAGEPVIGWYLTTVVTQGDAQIRVRKDLLPEGTSAAYQTSFRSDALVVVPPFLSPGNWYVEVKGVGATDYTLTSSTVVPQRTWTMPAVGEAITTPGLSVPLFGDSGVNDSGLPLPVDQGVDLNNGFYHVYSVEVPGDNSGLLRTQLEAISGNPNVYIRAGDVPTLDHDDNGSGTLYDRYLNGTANTEYGNWVPVDGRYASALQPGTWYLMVKADGVSNARYRLKVSGGNAYAGGNVQDLVLDGGSYSSQNLADNDFRHYRVEVPTNAPANWNITYAQSSGNIDLYIRDTLPVGNDATFSDSVTYVRDWNKDLKNRGTPRPNFPNAGMHTLNMPPLRPGHVYYLSFVATSDAVFSIGSAVSGGTIPVYEKLDFGTGTVSTNVPAGGSITYQVDVPPDAVRWIHSATNSAALKLYLEQGTLPSRTTLDHWYRTTESYTLNQYLLNADGWPWLPNFTYYLTVTNPSANPEPFDLVMSGSTSAEIPQNLTASDGTYPDYVRVQWSAISGVSAFNIWRNTTNDAPTAMLLAGAVGGTTYNDSSAAVGQLYHYWASVAGVTNPAWFSSPDSGWRPGVGSISPTQRAHSAAGGVGNIAVTAGTGVHWTAVEGLSWISILSGTPGTNNGTVVYSVGVYAGEIARTGTVSVAGQAFTVIQEAFGVATNLVATDGDYEDRTEITWDPVAGATRYYLYRGVFTNELDASYIGYVTTNIFNDIDGALEQVYYYWVRPYNAGGYGGYGTPDTGFRSSGVPPASWKMLHFPGGYPGNEVDSDGDGFTNLEEFIADTIPTNALSYFQIDDVAAAPGGAMIYWNSVSGRIYGVRWTESLTNSWTPITNGIPYPQGVYTDAVHSANDTGFYSLEVELE